MAFENLDSLLRCFADLGVERVLCKPLAENDNSKQQVYLGSGFETLNLLPYGDVSADPSGEVQTFKAPVAMSWIDSTGLSQPAPGAQLILYPSYPEVRLSGFLRGCPIAPSAGMKPVPKADRRFNNGPDGRLLFFGVRADKSVLAYLALAGSAVAEEFHVRHAQSPFVRQGVFLTVPLTATPDPRRELIDRLRHIHATGWIRGTRLDASGAPHPYFSPNGGGYTLEAQFGIVPNGRAAPDFQGWELKAFSGNRITLMTPEPDGGYYGDEGVEAFLRRYGRRVDEDTLYFTGVHRVNEPCTASGMRLVLRGFNPHTKKITDVAGGIELVDPRGNNAASWSFRALIRHWGRKHAFAAYVPYASRDATIREYHYLSPVLLGEGTDFALCLASMHAGTVVYDPAPKLTGLSESRTRTKARSQFRVSRAALASLYHRLESVPLDGQ